MIVRVALSIVVLGALFLFFYPREYRAVVGTYSVTDDSRQVVLNAFLGCGDSVIGSEVVREDARTVSVIVRARDRGGRTAPGCMGEPNSIRVTLRDPIGERTVIDGTDMVGVAGHVVPRVP